VQQQRFHALTDFTCVEESHDVFAFRVSREQINSCPVPPLFRLATRWFSAVVTRALRLLFFGAASTIAPGIALFTGFLSFEHFVQPLLFALALKLGLR
jgi:hypothetical protein